MPEEKSSFLQLEILPFVDIETMSRLFQLSDVVIGKPGGATSFQIGAQGAQLIAISQYPWENPNKAFLEARGLCHWLYMSGDPISLASAIKLRSEKRAESRFSYEPPEPFDEALISLLTGDVSECGAVGAGAASGDAYGFSAESVVNLCTTIIPYTPPAPPVIFSV